MAEVKQYLDITGLNALWVKIKALYQAVDDRVSGLGSVFSFKGTKASVADLPTEGAIGDVWHVTADSGEYVWDGTKWELLGLGIDLSGYLTKVDAQALLDALQTELETKIEAADEKAAAAQTAAATAQTTANEAKTAAATADTKATNAQSAAEGAQSAADAAGEAAAAAGTAAGEAQTTATEAKTAAGNAQTTATEAKTAAASAQATADAAKAKADTALQPADIEAIPVSVINALS